MWRLAQFIRETWFRAGSLVKRRSIEQELDEELRSHLEHAVAEKIADGMPRLDAIRQARLELGGLEQLKEAYRDQRGLPWLDQGSQDFRRAFHGLIRSRAFSLGAVSVLALGAAAVAVVKMCHDGIIHSDPPYLGEENRTVAIFVASVEKPTKERHVSVSELLEWSTSLSSFETIAGYAITNGPVTAGGRHDFAVGAGVSAGFFEMLSVRPALGRTFSAEEHAAAFPAVIIISHRFWQERYGGAADVIGRQAAFYRSPMTIVGVMPPDFDFPNAINYWAPLQNSIVPLNDRKQQRLALMGRLKPNVSIAAANAEVATLVSAQESVSTPSGVRRTARVIPVRERFNMAHTSEWNLFLFAAIAVQLLAALNVAGMLLARGLSRVPERALKSALGASRGRLFREALAESVLLAALGSVLGLGFTAALEPFVLSALGANLRFPTWWQFGFTLETMGTTLLLTFSTVLICTAFPAWRSTDVSLDNRLRSLNSGRTGIKWPARFRTGAICLQLVIAVALTMSAIRAAENVHRLQELPLGIDAENVGWIGVAALEIQGGRVVETQKFFDNLEQEVGHLRGVSAAGVADSMPGMDAPSISIRLDAATESKPLEGIAVRSVTNGALRALKIGLMQGRLLEPGDASSENSGILVDSTFANLAFPGEDPIGHTVTMEGSQTKQTRPARIVGVVQPSRNTLFQDPIPTIYRPYGAAEAWNFGTVFFRTHGDPARVIDAISESARHLNDRISILPHFDGRYATFIQLSYWTERFLSRVMSGFALLAMIISLAGIYATVSFAVTERRREIGIKLALGATPRRVMSEFCFWGVRIALLAATVGMIAAALAGPWYLAQFRRTFPPTIWLYAGTCLFVLLAVLLACWLPARGAARADPMEALRCD